MADAFVALVGADPGAHREDRILGHMIAITATCLGGIHSGRRRYMIGCVTCGVLIHEATTGPAWNIERHIAHEAGER